MCASHLAWAQEETDVAADAAGVALNLPADMELTVLVDIVSRKLSLNILYDEQIRGKRVTLKTPRNLPKDSLLTLLESALRMKGLALVEGEHDGWKKIVLARELIDVAIQPGPKADQRATQAVTRVFKLEHATPQKIDPVIKPFLTKPGGNAIALDAQGLIVVTDYAQNMPRIERLIALTDRPGPATDVKFVAAKHLDAATLAEGVNALLSAEQRVGGTPVEPDGLDLEVTYDERTNQLILIGRPERIKRAVDAVAAFDVDLGLTTVVYQFRSVPPERIEKLAKELLDPSGRGRVLRTSVDREAGLLVATTTQANHTQIEELKRNLDVALTEDQNPVRFYKLENANAVEVLSIIQSLEGGAGLANVEVAPAANSGGSERGVNRFESSPPNSTSAESTNGTGPQETRESKPSSTGVSGLTPGAIQPAERALASERAVVTADPNTNSIIVVAEPAVQRVFEHLIQMLDRRRPQVMVEVTLVTVDTSDGFSLGVELRRADEWSDGRSLLFSSFGLSEVSGPDGEFALSPSLGFNGVALDADIGEVVLKALKSDGRSRVLSEPKLLVNDNATGTLASVAEAPFSSVNASDTVATTSFGGFVEAGTTISVTPQISEGDHIILTYDISLNSFGEGGGDDLPPPRQTNALASTVTIPDGQMIIIGGLDRTDESFTKQSLPLLGSIPGAEFLFGSRTRNQTDSTLFAFIRPVILRDDQFEDLKYLSAVDRKRAELPNAYPSSDPLLVQ